MTPSASSLSLDSLREGGEAFMQEISREYYLASSGQKSAAELQPIYDRYAAILGPDALVLPARAAGHSVALPAPGQYRGPAPAAR